MNRKRRNQPRAPSPSVAEPRRPLLLAALAFVRAARACSGVQRISLLGSILTAKPIPKDVDVLVTERASCQVLRNCYRLPPKDHTLPTNCQNYSVPLGVDPQKLASARIAANLRHLRAEGSQHVLLGVQLRAYRDYCPNAISLDALFHEKWK